MSDSMEANVEDVVIGFVAEELGMDPEEISQDMLFQDLADDPVYKTNIAMRLEDYYEIGISDLTLDRHIRTVGHLVSFVLIRLGCPA